MIGFVEKRPKMTFAIALGAAILLYLIFAIWPEWLTTILGSKRLFVSTLLNGLTLAALYFLAASGFTLIFGLMRNVNLAHGAMYLLGGYAGWQIADYYGNWYFGLIGAFLVLSIIGAVMQVVVFRRMQGDDLRQTLVTIGISIVAADLMLATWGGNTYQLHVPDWLFGSQQLPVVTAIRSNGDLRMLSYSTLRLVLLVAALVVGIGLWLFLNRTKIGMMIRAGVDDREILEASGVNVQLLFVLVFAIGAGLAGLAGAIGGSTFSISPGEDVRYLLASLIVVIVGGMGSISGAAIGAILIGMAEQFGLAYFPTYGVVFTFLIMIGVLAFRPQGLMGQS